MQSLSKVRKLESVKSYGIEIECFIGVEHSNKTPKRYEYLGFWYVDSDGSLSRTYFGDSAYEFVSQPLPMNWLLKEITRLEKRVGNWHANDSCGTHVHVNRKWLTDSKAEAIAKFLETLSDSDIKQLFGRVSKDYAYNKFDKKSRYVAVNFTNKTTIEFRMFAGGNAKWNRYCLLMADYMVKHAFQLNWDAIAAASDMFKAQEGV